MLTNFVAKGTPLFMEQTLFHDHNHYIRIMGYDKPIDFKLNTDNKSNEAITIDSEYKSHVNKE